MEDPPQISKPMNSKRYANQKRYPRLSSIMNNFGFQVMLHTFEPRYMIPDRKTFSQNYIPDKACKYCYINGMRSKKVFTYH